MGRLLSLAKIFKTSLAYRNVPTDAQDIVKFTQKRCPFNHMTVAYQKSAVINCGGYEDLQEDYYLWIKLVAQGQKSGKLAGHFSLCPRG